MHPITYTKKMHNACSTSHIQRKRDYSYNFSNQFLFKRKRICLDRFQRMLEAMPGFLLMEKEGSNSQEETLSEYL